LRLIANAFVIKWDLQYAFILQLGVIVYGYAAWVGWSNGGALGAVTSKRTTPALFMLAVGSGFLAMRVVKPFPGESTIELLGVELGWSFVSRSFNFVASLLVLGALSLVRRRVVPTFGVTVEEFLKPGSDASLKRHPGKARSLLRGVTLVVFGVAA